MTLGGIQGRHCLQAGVYLTSLNDEGKLHLKQAALITLGTSLLVLGSPARADEEGEQAGWEGNVLEQSIISSKCLT